MHQAHILAGKNIVFIGGGNMASAIIEGLLSLKNAHALNLTLAVSDKNPQKLEVFASKGLDIATPDIAHTLIQRADVVVLAVKPQAMNEIHPMLAPHLKNKLIISVMAGIPTTRLQSWFKSSPIIRTMPNLPACIGDGATGLFADDTISQPHKDIAHAIMSSVGMSAWVAHEDDLHAITAVAGSAPAYFFYVLEAMVDKAVLMGLDKNTAQQMACMSMIGAGRLAMHSDDIANLRQQVTSKGGTTAQALEVLMQHHIQGAFKDAMDACAKRSIELGQDN